MGWYTPAITNTQLHCGHTLQLVTTKSNQSSNTHIIFHSGQWWWKIHAPLWGCTWPLYYRPNRLSETQNLQLYFHTSYNYFGHVNFSSSGGNYVFPNL